MTGATTIGNRSDIERVPIERLRNTMSTGRIGALSEIRPSAVDVRSGGHNNADRRVLRANFCPTLVERLGSAADHSDDHDLPFDDQCDDLAATPDPSAGPSRVLTFCFMRLANIDNRVFKRLSRYEATLWRQTVQTLFALRHACLR